jgi:hypothetical protein
MSIPCTGCFSFTVECDQADWIASLQVQKSSPDVTVSNIVFQSSVNAYDMNEGACNLIPGGLWEAQFAAPPEGPGFWCRLTPTVNVTLVLPGQYNNPSGEAATVDSMFCTYQADISFPNIVLHPVSQWNCPQFTLLIASNDSRVAITPSSVLITNGFNSDIVLTLTLTGVSPNPQTIVTLSDSAGVCVDPVSANFAVDTDPVLSS